MSLAGAEEQGGAEGVPGPGPAAMAAEEEEGSPPVAAAGPAKAERLRDWSEFELPVSDIKWEDVRGELARLVEEFSTESLGSDEVRQEDEQL